jgi:hypothetical protein
MQTTQNTIEKKENSIEWKQEDYSPAKHINR